jgi:hypothetical protein
LIAKFAKSDSDFSHLSELLKIASDYSPFPALQKELSFCRYYWRSAFEWHSVEVWPGSMFHFRRIDSTLKSEFFSDGKVDGRYTWTHDSVRWMKTGESIRKRYQCQPFGLIFWSDGANVSNWLNSGFHPIMMRAINDPLGKFTLVGLLPTTVRTSIKSHKAYSKIAVFHRCYRILFNTAPLKDDLRTLNVYQQSKACSIIIKPFIFCLIGDLPELDMFGARVANQVSCRSCYATEGQLSASYSFSQPLEPRSLNLEHRLKKIALSNDHLRHSSPAVVTLKSLNTHVVKQGWSPKLLGGFFPLVDDLYHNFESGIGDNIRKHIFDAIRADVREQVGDFQNFLSAYLNLLATPPFSYAGQFKMSQGFDIGKKFGNFDARKGLLTELPFLLHSLVSRENLALHLSILYVIFRNLLEIPAGDLERNFYEKVRVRLLQLYETLICPHLAVAEHMKLHRIAEHMKWEDLLLIGCWKTFGTKTAEATLKESKQLWKEINGASFERHIMHQFNIKFLSEQRPLHAVAQAPSSSSGTFSKIIYYRRQDGHQSMPTTSLEMLGTAGLLQSSIIETAEKVRLESGMIFQKGCMVEYSVNSAAPEQSNSTDWGVVIEIFRIESGWKCLIVRYQVQGIDGLMFNLPRFGVTDISLVVPVSEIKDKIPMIPDLRALDRLSGVLPITPTPVWLRVTTSWISSSLLNLKDTDVENIGDGGADGTNGADVGVSDGTRGIGVGGGGVGVDIIGVGHDHNDFQPTIQPQCSFSLRDVIEEDEDEEDEDADDDDDDEEEDRERDRYSQLDCVNRITTIQDLSNIPPETVSDILTDLSSLQDASRNRADSLTVTIAQEKICSLLMEEISGKRSRKEVDYRALAGKRPSRK